VRDDRIEAGRRLVVEHAVRVRHDRAREAGAFQHAARELRRNAIDTRCEADALERPHHDRVDLRFRTLRVFAQRQRDVLADRQSESNSAAN
jgi:hypothetical protein